MLRSYQYPKIKNPSDKLYLLPVHGGTGLDLIHCLILLVHFTLRGVEIWGFHVSPRYIIFRGEQLRKNGINYRKNTHWNLRVIGNFLHSSSSSHESRMNCRFRQYDNESKGQSDFFKQESHEQVFHSFFSQKK